MAETDLVPAGARPSPLSSGMTGLSGLMNQPAVKRSLPLIGLLSALALAALAWWTFQTPAQRPLFDGLAENDKAAVASALQSAGVEYKLDGASGAISVAEQDFHRARMLLAGQGLPKAAPSGDSLISALPMGASRAVEGQTLKSAREADLARTIEAIDQVASARVHLATPDPSPFVRDAAPPAASVMLRLQPGRALSDAQVRAIRHLVASSVPGLNADQVSVIDQSGALLSQQGGSGADQQFQLQTQMEERYRQALVTLLTPIMGAGNFSTEVHVELERSEIQSTRETYPKDDMALRQEQGNKSVGSSSQTAGGIRAVIEQAVGVDRAASLLAGIAPIASPRLAQLLDWMDAEVIATLLKREHPQVGALVLASLEPDVAAAALAMIDEGRQADMLLRAARLGKVSRDAVTELEVIVARYSGGDQAPPPKVELGGSSGVAKIVNNLGRPRGERLIKAIRKSDRPIADAIEEDMFVFEDLLTLDAKALGTVMRSVDASNLVFALKGASPELAERILASMSQRAADSIRDEMAERTMVKRSEVDAAQKAIIALTRQLADAGEIVLGSEGNDYV